MTKTKVRTEPAPRVEARGAAPQPDERVLDELLGHALILQEPQPQPVERRLVATIEVDERLAVVVRGDAREQAGVLVVGGRPLGAAVPRESPPPMPDRGQLSSRRPAEGGRPSCKVFASWAPPVQRVPGPVAAGSALGERDGDVNHRALAADRPERAGAAVEEADLVEARRSRRRSARRRRRSGRSSRCGPRCRCRSRRTGPASTFSLPVGTTEAGVRRRLDHDLVGGRVEVVAASCRCRGRRRCSCRRPRPRRGSVAGGGPGDVRVASVSVSLSASTLSRRFWPVSLTIRRRSTDGVEVDPEGRALERHVHPRLEGRAGALADRVDAALVAERVEVAGGGPVVDADDRRRR